MTLRKLTTPHGEYFVCCVSPFHGQVCPDCRAFYENPAEIIAAEDARLLEEAARAAGKGDYEGAANLVTAANKVRGYTEAPDQEDESQPVTPAPTTEITPSVEEAAQEGAEDTDENLTSAPREPAKPKRQPRQPRQPKN